MKKLQYPPENEILYLKGVINYTEFHLINGRKEISSSTLLRHQERHERFLRVNKSHLINPNCIKRIIKDGPFKEVVLNNGFKVKVSRRRTDVFKPIKCYKMKLKEILLCLFALLSFSYSNGQNFANKVSIDNLYVQDLVSGDVDSDGDIDIIYLGLDYSGYYFKILINDGCGNFTSKSNTIGSFTSASLGLSDLNADSKLDLIINGTLEGDVNTHVYLNDGSGNFTSTAQQISSLLGKVKVADLDGQNGPDLLIAGKEDGEYSASPEIKIYINNGAGTFSESVGSSFSNIQVNAIVCENLDQDTDADFAVINDNGVYLFRNNGNALFTQETIPSLKGGISSKLVIGDFNNDNNLDLITSGIETPSNQKFTELHLNNGTGQFNTQAQSPFNEYSAGTILPVDIENDNDIDLVFRGTNASNTQEAKIFKNNGNGVFTAVEDETLSLLTGGLYTIDSKGNGIQNILSSSFNGIGFSLDIIENTGPLTTQLSECSSYTWIDGQTYTQSIFTSFNMIGAGTNGCDSTVYLDLTIYPTTITTDYVITSERSHTWIDGNTYTTSSSNAASFFIPNGQGSCQDEIILNLKLNENGVNPEDEPEFKWVHRAIETSQHPSCIAPTYITSTTLSNGDAIVAGISPCDFKLKTPSGEMDLLSGNYLARYSKNGQLLWVKSNLSIDVPTLIGTDEFDNIYVPSSNSTTQLIRKYSGNGDFVMDISLQGIGVLFKTLIVQNNIIYLGGYIRTSGGKPIPFGLPSPTASDGLIATLNATTGAVISANSIEGAGECFLQSLDVDSQGNIYITGDIVYTNDFDLTNGENIQNGASGFFQSDFSGTVFLAKYDSNLSLQWVKPFRTSGGTIQRPTGMKINMTTDDIYLTGYFRNSIDLDPSGATFNVSTNHNRNFFIAQYNSDGDLNWGKGYGGNDEDEPKAIDIDSEGNLLVAGNTNVKLVTHPENSNWELVKADIEIHKYMSTGSLAWIKSFTSDYGHYINEDQNSLRNISATPNGGFVVAGTFTRSMDFDDSPAYNVLNANTAYDNAYWGQDLFFMSYGNVSPCSENLALSSPTDDITTGTIELEANSTTGYINAENKLSNGTNTIYRAGRYIKLEPGFLANTGAIFKTEFGGCEE